VIIMGLQLTRGGEYAIRAMTYLARRPVGEITALHGVGVEQDIPESFLAKIFQSLVHAGLVVSQRGAHGGFSLARPPAEITVREIVEAVDGPIALNGCVLWPEDCRRSGDCRMHEVWILAQERMMDVLGQVTLAELAPVPASSPA
jgi:Rrf2 family transcriptional regulator, iron-sulfur cluster assembly transcription factor